MKTPANTPKTLLKAIRYFSDLDLATEYVAKTRWSNGPVCSRCGILDPKHYYLKTRKLWKCRACKKQVGVKVGTIFEDGPLGLDKWLPALWVIAPARTASVRMSLLGT
jgi:transposase-like protein